MLPGVSFDQGSPVLITTNTFVICPRGRSCHSPRQWTTYDMG